MYSVPRKFFTTTSTTKSSNASTHSSSSGRKTDYKPNVQCTYCHGHFFNKDAYKVHKDHCEPRRQWWLKYSQELPGRL